MLRVHGGQLSSALKLLSYASPCCRGHCGGDAILVVGLRMSHVILNFSEVGD